MNPKCKKRFLVFFFYTLTILMVLSFAVNILDIANWKDLSKDSITNLAQSLRIYDRSGNLLSILDNGQSRTKISLQELPQHVKDAFICAEDIRFYEHGGIDAKRVLGAILADLKAGSFKEGASTITQQLIKNSHLTSEKSLSRKAQEAVLAMQLESLCSKDEILEMYLNYIYFGNHAYGIGAAAQTYFSKPASELTLDEAAMLAGIIKSPSAYAPHVHPERALSRRDVVLDLMLQYEKISQEQHDEAIEHELVLNLDLSDNYVYGYYMDEILRSGCQLLGVELEELLSGGYSIHTNMDSDLQYFIQCMVQESAFSPDTAEKALPQCAIVVLEPGTNRVLAVCGGRTHEVRLCFNRATMMKRSPGSTIKPILVYGAAIESGAVNAATIFHDAPKTFGNFTPTNFGNKYYGNITVREALIKSVNTTSVEILNEMGIENGKAFAKNFGIKFDERDTGLTLALGGFTYGISPMDLASAYSAFANGGFYSQASYIDRIEDLNGNTVYRSSRRTERIMSESTSFIISDILRQAALKSNSCFSDLPDLGISVKTGTVNHIPSGGNSDAWLCAYNSEYTVTTWMGYDKTGADQHLSSEVTGSSYPAKMASSIFRYLYKDRSAPSIQVPSSVSLMELDKTTLYESGKQELATPYTPRSAIIKEYFSSVSFPKQASSLYSPPPAITELSAELNTFGLPIISFDCSTPNTRCNIFRLTEECTLIQTVQGGSGKISITDFNAVKGQENRYFVVVENPLALSNGQPLSSSASKRISIFVP